MTLTSAVLGYHANWRSWRIYRSSPGAKSKILCFTDKHIYCFFAFLDLYRLEPPATKKTCTVYWILMMVCLVLCFFSLKWLGVKNMNGDYLSNPSVFNWMWNEGIGTLSFFIELSRHDEWIEFAKCPSLLSFISTRLAQASQRPPWQIREVLWGKLARNISLMRSLFIFRVSTEKLFFFSLYQSQFIS